LEKRGLCALGWSLTDEFGELTAGVVDDLARPPGEVVQLGPHEAVQAEFEGDRALAAKKECVRVRVMLLRAALLVLLLLLTG